MLLKIRSAALVAASVLLAAACGDGSDPVAPPTTGTITITVETVGTLPDPNGYQVTRAGATPLDVPVNGSVRLDSVAPGSYTFDLGKQSLYCVPENGATRTAQVVAGQTATVNFRVRCERNGVAYTAFNNNVASLYVLFPGRDPITLATGISASRIRFSPDRRRIAYTGGGTTGISTIDLDSLAITQITPAGSPIRFHPSWSPDGTRIAYATTTELRVIGVGQTAETTIWRAPAGINPSMPVWSPDGSRIAFLTSDPRGNEPTRIRIVNADGTGARELIALRTIPYIQIDWSPDGAAIAYSDDEPGAVYTVNVASGQETRVTAPGSLSYRNVTYLPDGRIGFFAQAFPATTPAGNWIVNADGSNLTPVTIPSPTGAPVTAWQ